MKLSIIVAMAHHRVIGKDNQMPWHMPADLQHFKKITLGKPIVMGRKTFDSIGRALPGRRNVVITRQQGWQAPGCDIFHSLEDALAALRQEPEVMVIGGSTIFEQVLPWVEAMYMTFIEVEALGDTFFPKWDDQQWQVLSEEKHLSDEKNPHAYRFVTLVRR